MGHLTYPFLFDAFVKTNSYSKIWYIIYHFFGFVNPLFLLFNVLKVVKGGHIRTMVIAHSPAQRSSELTANCD